MLALVTAFVAVTVALWLLLLRLGQANDPIDIYPPPAHPKPTYHDVQYICREGCDPALTSLDVYLPAPAGPHPVIIYIHGGAWQNGDKIPVSNVDAFKRAGIAIVSINYRLSPAVKHPAHVEDVAAAIAFIRDNAGKYEIDPGKIFLMGHSAGAHLAALVATDRRRLAVHGMAPAELAGVILLDGSSYDIPLLLAEYPDSATHKCKQSISTQPAMLIDASPAAHAKEAGPMPAFLLIHAGKDVITARQADVLADALRQGGAKMEIHHDPQKDHGSVWYLLGDDGDPLTDRVMRFLRSRMGGPATSSGPASAPE